MFADDILSSNLGFFILINLNIIVVMVLGFLVIKNIVKLLLDRRRNILGAKLRSRLVTAFVGLSLVPTILLFLVAKGILSSVLEGWFSPQIATSVDSAMGVAKYHYGATEELVSRQARHIAQRLHDLYPEIMTNVPRITSSAQEKAQYSSVDHALERYLKRKLQEYGLSEIALADRSGKILLQVHEEALGNTSQPSLYNSEAIQEAFLGSLRVRSEQFGMREILRTYAPIIEEVPSLPSHGSVRTLPYCLITTLAIAPEFSSTLAKMIDAYDDYKELGIYRRPLVSSYLLTLVVVTLMIVFAAIWVGFYLSKTLTEPIQLLADGTRQVAHGNLAYRIPEIGDDELSILVRSFNKMTGDLQETTDELVSRRRHMETVLASVGVGVISVDRQGRIATFNVAAANMTGVPTTQFRENAHRANIDTFLPTVLSKKIQEMLEELYQSSDSMIHSNISLSVLSESKHLQITISKLADEFGSTIGAVILLDDLTALVSAQRMAAWREVARRIAHEIKNPLTPIQLCAQRIQRRLMDKDREEEQLHSESTRELVSASADMIVRQVETLRTLVNEFSAFARMPKASPQFASLNAILLETGSMYRDAHPEITFEFEFDNHIPVIKLDREQISRVLINLLDNAVQSVRLAWPCQQTSQTSQIQDEFDELHLSAKASAQKKTDVIPGTANITAPHYETAQKNLGQQGILGIIRIRSVFKQSLGLVSVEVSDNGTGIADLDKPKLFEPYFSKKKGGSGLGLAIASAIIADHNGFIRVRDNKPRGATFIIELPVEHTRLAKAL